MNGRGTHMNSQWNLEGGSYIPPENDLWSSTWAPLTPEKPIQVASNATPASTILMTGQVSGADNSWPQGLANGYLQEMPSCSISAQGLNLNEVATESNHHLRHGNNFTGGNQITQQNAGPSSDIFEVDGISWSNRPFTDILASASLGFIPLTTGGGSGVGLGASQDFWSLDNLTAPSNCSNLRSGSKPIANLGHTVRMDALRNNCMPAQESQCAFPLPSRPVYDLNSIPPSEGNAPQNITKSLQYVPETPDQAKMRACRLSANDNTTPDERSAQESAVQVIPQASAEGTQNHSQVLLEKYGECSRLGQENTVDHVEGIDLNATPQMKHPKRKKHRPKVIVEGKPKREEPKKAQEKAHEKESTAAKRKYVRRKGLKESDTQQPNAAGTGESQDQAAKKSSRRALNFDLEQTTLSISTDEREKMKSTDQPSLVSSVHSPTPKNSTVNGFMQGATSAQRIQREEGALTQNQPVVVPGYAAGAEQRAMNMPLLLKGVATGFSSTKMKDQQIQDMRGREARDTIRVNSLSDLMNGHVPAQYTNRHVGLEGERNLTVASTSQQTPGQLEESIFPSNEGPRGSKRPHYQNHEQAYPPSGSPSTFQTIWQLLQLARSRQNNNGVSPELLNALKKKKTENGLNAQRDDMPSWVAGANDCSRQRHLKLSNVAVPLMPSQLLVDRQNGSALDIYRKMREKITEFPALDIYRKMREKITGFPQECYSYPGSASNKNENHVSAQWQSYLQWKEVAGRVLNANCTNLTAVQACKIQMSREKGSSYGSKAALKGHEKSLSVKALPPIKPQPTPSRGRQKHVKKEIQHLHHLSGTKQEGTSSQRENCDPLDQITHQLCRLNLNGDNAIVLYKGDGTIIPYEGPEPRRRKPRPKVDLDPETNRIWNLLMGKESEGLQNDKDKEKWWQEEREVFRGRANSFIARMHLIQGDRRFSRWKGSVVDSVIGVFLTQNVSDHLSSSAFMSLVARFPASSNRNSTIPDKFSADLLFKEPVPHTTSSRDRLVSHEHMQQTNTKASLESWTDQEVTGIERQPQPEGQTHSSEEDIISSQESFDCSVMEGYGGGGVRSSSGSNSESEDIVNHLKPEDISCFILGASVRKEKSTSQELQIHTSESKVALEHEQSNCSKYDHQGWRLDGEKSTNGSSWCDSLINSDKQPVRRSSPPIESKIQLKDSRVPRVEDDLFAEESIESCLTMLKSCDAELRSQGPLNQRVLLGSKGKQLMGTQPTIINASNTGSPNSISGPNPSQSSYTQQLHESEKSISQEAGYATKVDGLREPMAPKDNTTYMPLTPQKTVLGDCSAPGIDRHFHSQDMLVEINPAQQLSSLDAPKETQTPAKAKRGKALAENRKIDWDNLRKEVQVNGGKKERSEDNMDSIDYEALRQASTSAISETIRERGMNNMLAERIKGFLDRLVEEHGSIDLEWLRDVPPDKAKDYLLSIRGLGLKSVECVRLLTLHNLAFPVDTNVGRIAVRLGWVPLQPLPESLQLHLLELYPVLESIQKYLWPRLCKLDQPTLYELHYQLITFGKVFCTKSRPNCNGCPMRGECRHFASAFASARLALPAPEDKSLVPSAVTPKENTISPDATQMLLPTVQDQSNDKVSLIGNCNPIIEEPATPEEERAVALDRDIEDLFAEDDDEIPTIKLNIKEFTSNLQTFMQANNMELQEADMSKALVALNPEAASIPARKLKNVSRLRTEHQVYELPDDHPLLEGLEKREADDPSPYLLAIWTAGETPNSVQQPQEPCKLQNTGSLCKEMTCFSCNSIREAQSQTVRGTLLIPCRTAMRGSFPLNGTYFQVNEMFADHQSSLEPLFVPRDSLWNLRRRTVYFGTSVTAIFRGLSTEEVQYCFWRGFVCVRGFERETCSPRPLVASPQGPFTLTNDYNQTIKIEAQFPQRLTAKRLSHHDFTVYLCSTPINLASVEGSLSQEYSCSIRLIEIDLEELPDLPSQYHATRGLPPHLMNTLKRAFDDSGPAQLSSAIDRVSPDLLIYDFLSPWTLGIARAWGIPAVFLANVAAGVSCFLLHMLKNTGKKFPSKAIYIPEYFLVKMGEQIEDNQSGHKDIDRALQCFEESQDIVLSRTFGELEANYMDYLSKLSGKTVVPLGPLVQERVTQDDEKGLIRWLDEKGKSSTVFVSFGTEYFLCLGNDLIIKHRSERFCVKSCRSSTKQTVRFCSKSDKENVCIDRRVLCYRELHT
ncbi:hypothetical protein MLD38_009844 [Melastoma candidum]|uniref:Uncharacterized protein n=1 Tax=Melastoma candidum TaxID=119954 RepID=A0ACB9S046_9MYRT|nr:hypothetical protein MLD38_009844 [Melastoma candidum]